MTKLNSTKFNSAKFEELDLDLLSEISAGMSNEDLENWQIDVFENSEKWFGFVCDARGMNFESTVSFYAASCGVTESKIRECADLYASDGGITWNKVYQTGGTPGYDS